MNAEHYVLVIHGTGNAPAIPPRWHQLDEHNHKPDGTNVPKKNFCTLLNDLFEQTYGMGRPVWRPCGELPRHFNWGGANEHSARIEGGIKLCDRILEIEDKRPSDRIDLVGHSHGCNVILFAVQRYLHILTNQAYDIAWEAARALKENPEHAIESALQKTFGAKWGQVATDHQPELAILHDDLAKALQEAREEDEMRPGLRKLVRYFRNLGSLGRHFVSTKVEKGRFIEAWVLSRQSNHLGRIVLLGPPFFFKYWARTKWWSPSLMLSELFNIAFFLLLGLIFSGIVSYVFVFLPWVLVWVGSLVVNLIFETGLAFPSFNPLQWPSWIQAAYGLLVLIYTGAVFSGYRVGWGRDDTNLYFDESNFDPPSKGRNAAPPSEAVLPLDTLVVSAGYLDEVVLGFSAEPLVFGALVPQLRSLLYEPREPHAVAGQRGGKPHRMLLHLAAKGIGFVRAGAMNAFRKHFPFIERFLTKKLLQVVSAPAFGLVPAEFSTAHIVASDHLGIPRFFKTRYWKVDRLLLESPPIASEPQGDRLSRYAFLWSEKEFEARKQKSELWAKVQTMLDEITRRYQAFPELKTDNLEKRLATTSLMLEERLDEIRGIVQLDHSAYYSNEKVLECIARFVATGESPFDAVQEAA